MMYEFIQQMQNLSEKNISYVMVTLTGITGSAPQIVGAKMLVTEQGLFCGTVGGGKIEAHCIKTAQKMLGEEFASCAFEWNLQKDIGMSCGGKVNLFFDVQRSSGWNLVIFGAGHISQELCRVLSTWTCQISVFDTRSEWISKLPQSHNIKAQVIESLPDIVSRLPKNSYILCMTQGHATDLPILKKAFEHYGNFKMIGVIGSEIKAKKIKLELISQGIDSNMVERLHCPLGLPIGNSTPCEIAISICAQLLMVRDNLFKITEFDWINKFQPPHDHYPNQI